jgi:hypothetical protein
MGLLDELRAKSERLRAQEDDQQEADAQRELVFKRQIKPRFKSLYNYLRELVEHLNYLKTEIKVSYRLPGCETPFDFVQKDYLITADSSDNLGLFNLRCKAVGAKPIYLRLDDEQNPDKIIQSLRQHNIVAVKRGFSVRQTNANNFVEVKPEIPISFAFKLDAHKFIIIATANNFPDLGKIRRGFDAKQVDDQWIEDVGDMIVRKHDIITTLPISDTERQRIKQAIRDKTNEDSEWKWYNSFKKDSH